MSGNLDEYTLCRVEDVPVGSTVIFIESSDNYRVDSVEITGIGMVRHRHGESMNTYWPDELVCIQEPRM